MWSNPQSLLPEAQLELMVKQAPNGTGFGWTGRAGVARQMRIPPREPRIMTPNLKVKEFVLHQTLHIFSRISRSNEQTKKIAP
jgi:hypothetical protein